MSTFTVTGVSTQNGVTKVRFANDLASRVKLLSKGGHSPLELIELPSAMTKAEACQHLLDIGGVFAQWSNLISDTMDKKTGTVTAVAAPKVKPINIPAKNPKGPAKKKQEVAKEVPPKKIAKPKAKVEDDFDVTEYTDILEEVGEALV